MLQQMRCLQLSAHHRGGGRRCLRWSWLYSSSPPLMLPPGCPELFDAAVPPPLPPQHTTALHAAERSWRTSVKLKTETLNVLFNLIISEGSPGHQNMVCLEKDASWAGCCIVMLKLCRLLLQLPSSDLSCYPPHHFNIIPHFICAITWYRYEMKAGSATSRCSWWIIDHMYRRLFKYKIGCTMRLWFTSPLHDYAINIDHAEPFKCHYRINQHRGDQAWSSLGLCWSLTKKFWHKGDVLLLFHWTKGWQRIQMRSFLKWAVRVSIRIC